MAKNDTIKTFRVNIRDLAAPADAEPLYDKIEDSEELTASDKQKLQQELNVRVNTLKQAEHDAKAEAGDVKGAAAAIAEKEDNDESGKSRKKKLIPKADAQARDEESESDEVHIPEGCVRKEISSEELKTINADPEKAKTLCGVKPIYEGKGMPISKYIAILKAALALFVCVSFTVPAFAALASDDVAALTDFAQTKGIKVNASGNVVPVTDSAISLGASGTEFSAVYTDALTIGGGTALAKVYHAADAVASGQTSKATTITGVTTSSRCVASAAEVATNAVYIRAVVPTANTVTVTTSGDPGASNMDYKVICVE